MIQQFIHDIKWKYLIISTILAFLILLVLAALVASMKSETLFFMFKNGHLQFNGPDQIEKTGNDFLNSSYWAPIHIIQIIFSQIISCWYLIKRSPGVELTNGLGHGIFLSVVLYQLHPISSVVAITVSILVAYKMKSKKQGKLLKLN